MNSEKDIHEMIAKPKLDRLRDRMSQVNSQAGKPSLLNIPYHGSRTGYFVYHPRKFPNQTTAYDEARKVFATTLKSWYDVLELYHDDSPLSEKIITDAVKKDIQKILDEIEKGRNPYDLEALAELLWNREGATQLEDGKFDGPSEKSTRHDLSWMSEIKRRAEELRHEDCGIILSKPIAGPPIKHGWGG